MVKRPYRRRNYFIDKDFQGRFVLMFVLLASLGGAISVGLFNYLAQKRLDVILYSIHIPAKRINELLSSDMVYANLFSFFVVLLFLVMAMNRLTIAIAGPLHRIRKDLKEVAKGDLSFNITLRYKDEFKSFASETNSLIEALRDSFGQIKTDVDTIDRYVREIERNNDKPDIIKVKNQHIQSHLEQLQKRLEFFRV
ncbi:MAG: methyl-accepting chemotaxis protein [Nitrospirae bacterium]|nr:MAG: methyl-accepting chemotaxis protein [Nitrospirota bacterium]